MSERRTGAITKVLMLAMLPPPVHGASLMNQLALDELARDDAFAVRVLNMAPRQQVDAIGRWSLRKVLQSVSVWARVFLLAMQQRPDVAYVTIAPSGYAFYRDAVTVLILRLLGIRRLYHQHGLGVAGATGLSRWLYRRVYSGADVIGLSAATLRDISGLRVGGGVFTLPNAIADPCPAGALRTPQDGACTLLFLGNFLPGKGALLLLEAMSRLAAERPDLRLVMAGAFVPPLTRENLADTVARLSLDARVTLLGPTFGADKDALFRAAHVFALPSEIDAFPLTLLEAMAYSLPVVSTTQGAIPEMVDDGLTGIIVPPRDLDALTAALARLVDDPAMRKQMGEAGRRKFEQCYTAQRFGEGLKAAVLATARGGAVASSTGVGPRASAGSPEGGI